MRIIFTTNKKGYEDSEIEREIREIRGYGAIGGIIGPLAESSAGKKRSRREESITIEVQKRPSLSDQEVRKRNDDVLSELGWRIEHIERLQKYVPADGYVIVVLNKKKEEYSKAGSEFVHRYEAQHGVAPQGNLSKRMGQYENGPLVEIYLAFVLKTGKEKPSQLQLSEFSNVSQATWSRVFKKREFWELVMGKLEVVWNAHSIAKQYSEQIEGKRAQPSRIAPDGLSSEIDTYAEGSRVSNTTEDDLDAHLDLKIKYEKMSKDVLTKRILASDPGIRKSELDPMTHEQLVEIAIEMEV